MPSTQVSQGGGTVFTGASRLDHFSKLVLYMCTGILLPISLWRVISTCLTSSTEDPMRGSEVDERTHILNLQGDTVYLGSLSFFVDPYRFLLQCQRALRDSTWFRFHFCGKGVVVISDISSANRVLENECFSLLEGHMMLVPGRGKELCSPISHGSILYSRYVKQLSQSELIDPAIPHIVRNAVRYVESWGNNGVIKSWDALTELVNAACFTLVLTEPHPHGNPVFNKYMRDLQWVSRCVSPDALVLPWFPTPSRLRYVLGCVSISRTLSDIYDRRKNTATEPVTTDMVQILIDGGVGSAAACQVLMTVLFLASSDASRTIFWLFAYLLQHPVWLERVQEEVRIFVEHFATAGCEDVGEVLSHIPLAEWESLERFKSLDLCLQETLRLVANGTLPRRNMGPDTTINGKTILHGEFTLLMTENLHSDADIYPDPLRFIPDRDQTKAQHSGSFIGWGRGVHPCSGKRAAHCIIRIATLVILSKYTLDIYRDDDLPPGIVPGIKRSLSQSSVADPVEELRFVYSITTD